MRFICALLFQTKKNTDKPDWSKKPAAEKKEEEVKEEAAPPPPAEEPEQEEEGRNLVAVSLHLYVLL